MPRHTASFIRTCAVALGFGVVLGACGFQLRGVGEGAALPEEWKKMHLVTGNPNSEFSRAITTRFAANGVEWVEKADANYILILGPDRFKQSSLSLSSDARVSQLELTMSAKFAVKSGRGKEVMPESTATVVSTMENDPYNAMGKSEEVRILKSEMYTDLARQILRRIGFFASSGP